MGDSFTDSLGGGGLPNSQAGGGTNTSTTADQLRNQVLSGMLVALQNGFPRVAGTFTLAAAATTVVPQTATESTSLITLTPTNAAAATLMGSAKSLYVSARTQGASFTVATANATSAAGTETFAYSMLNLV
jgi:hypothetical protein